MRITLAKLAGSMAKPMSIISRPSKTALGKKYNYGIRVETPLDDIHGYMWWVCKYKFHDIWPLLVCKVFWVGLVTYIVWWSFQKTTVQFNRFSEHRPWDWERARYVYDKPHKALYNDAAMWKRIPELDKIQEEMLQAKQQRLADEKANRKGKSH